MTEEIQRPSMPSAVTIVVSVSVLFVGFLLAKSAIGFVFGLIKTAAIVAVISGLVWVGFKIYTTVKRTPQA